MTDDRNRDLTRRLEALGDRLRKAKAADAPVTGRSATGSGSAMGLGFRIATDLVAAVVVGAAIGWGLDHWLGTRPVFLLIFFILGVGAGVMNVYRVTKPKPGETVVPNDRLPSVPEDEDDDDWTAPTPGRS